jgi:hypothetical protein
VGNCEGEVQELIEMFRKVVVLVVLAIGTALALSCGDDSTAPTGRESPPLVPVFHKSDVLKNIEYAYHKRAMQTYDALLDENFTFFYGDSGTPVQWGRSDEITTTSGLIAAASSIDLSLDWKDAYGNSTVTWTEQISGTETWYYTTVYYHFTIKIGDTTYIPNAGSKAQFTVRNAGTTDKQVWKLIEFRDLGGPSVLSATSAATKPTTWGGLKALYR